MQTSGRVCPERLTPDPRQIPACRHSLNAVQNDPCEVQGEFIGRLINIFIICYFQAFQIMNSGAKPGFVDFQFVVTHQPYSGAALGFVDFRESVQAIKANPLMAAEMLEVTDYLMAEVEVVEKELDLGYPFPLTFGDNKEVYRGRKVPGYGRIGSYNSHQGRVFLVCC